jgi:hypothetical protein
MDLLGISSKQLKWSLGSSKMHILIVNQYLRLILRPPGSPPSRMSCSPSLAQAAILAQRLRLLYLRSVSGSLPSMAAAVTVLPLMG